MKSLFKVAGIILAASFAVSMFASASASAAWEQCATEKAATAKSKYTTNQCTTASGGTVEWAWQAASGSESVRSRGSLKLEDIKEGIESECYNEWEGTLSKVEKVTVLSCRSLKGCEASTIELEARDLPWKTEQYDTEGKAFQVLKEEGADGEPGWAISCKILKVKDTDTCKYDGPETQELVNVNSSGELLVSTTFQHSGKMMCTLGGADSGEVTGSLALLKTNGWGLRVT